jgi:hypothetical protein
MAKQKQRFIIEIEPNDGNASACRLNGKNIAERSDLGLALADCVRPGDCEDSCHYVIETFRPEFRIVRRLADGTYANVLADDAEMQKCCQSIYFESQTDFSIRDNAELYLVWQAASDYVEGLRGE